MKMKLLDTALIGILAGMSANASAQDTEVSASARPAVSTGQAAPASPAAPVQRPAPSPSAPMDCSDDACSNSDGNLVFRLRTRSYDQPITTGTDKGSS